jgi:uncharacterized membrane protein YfcA
MNWDPPTVALVVLTFLLAGLVKGVIGVGLPTMAIGLLSLAMAPAQAAAIMVVPALITNIWQAAAGPHTLALIRRLWPMLLAVCIGTWLGAGLVAPIDTSRAMLGLGGLLVLYAIVGLTPARFSVPARAEPWLAPLVGALTGVASAATGVFMVPAIPYLQALSLDRDDLVQAIGLSVMVSSLALALLLAGDGMLKLTTAGASVLALVPAVGGMALGQLVRTRVRPDVFRTCFFVGLLLLGAHLAFRALI